MPLVCTSGLEDVLSLGSPLLAFSLNLFPLGSALDSILHVLVEQKQVFLPLALPPPSKVGPLHFVSSVFPE